MGVMVMSEDETVEVCPECNNATLANIVGTGKDGRPATDAEYRCQHCGVDVDDPAERDPERGQRHCRNGLAAEIIGAADEEGESDDTGDDLRADGGREHEEVLVSASHHHSGSDQVVHLPDPDAADQPRCGATGPGGSEWRRVDPGLYPDHDLCERCDPDVDHAAGGEGPQLASQVRSIGAAEQVRTDGHGECRRRTCERSATVRFSDERGAVRVRCDEHALVDAVSGVGAVRAGKILETVALETLVGRADRFAGVFADPKLTAIEGIGQATAIEIARSVAEGPLDADCFLDDRTVDVETEAEDSPLRTDGGQDLESSHARDFPIGREFVPEICEALDVSTAVRDAALELTRKYDMHQRFAGCQPSNVAAGAVYLAAFLNNEKRTQDEVAAAADTSANTVSKMCHIFGDLEGYEYADDVEDTDGRTTGIFDRLKEVLGR